MLQSGGLPTQLTAAETIRMWAGTCSQPMPPERALDAVDLTHRAKVKVGSLSGGEQRRLDLACALVGQPSILFLDEPTTGLDPESRRRVWRLLENLKTQGVTMILTTHYLEEAERLCDRIGIMHRGPIVLEGSLRVRRRRRLHRPSASRPCRRPGHSLRLHVRSANRSPSGALARHLAVGAK